MCKNGETVLFTCHLETINAQHGVISNFVFSSGKQVLFLYIYWHNKSLTLDSGHFQQCVISFIYLICKTDKEERKDKTLSRKYNFITTSYRIFQEISLVILLFWKYYLLKQLKNVKAWYNFNIGKVKLLKNM